MSLQEGVATVDAFIGLAKEIAKMAKMALPQYQTCARDLYLISQKILDANENTLRWFNEFRYFNFKDSDSAIKFTNKVMEYKTLKGGGKFQQLKYSCADIGSIYHRDISNKLLSFFSDHSKQEDAQGIFERLSQADGEMVAFVVNEVFGKLDKFVDSAESAVDNSNLDEAERRRMEFKRETSDIVRLLEEANDELTELVIKFASLARIPITISNPPI